MLSVVGVDRQVYWDVFQRGRPIPDIACPDPACEGQLLGSHAWYERYLDGDLCELHRLVCRRCSVTHAVLPEDVCAYHDATLVQIEAALEAGPGPAAASEAAGQEGAGARPRVRRWLRRLDGWLRQQVVGLLPAVAGSLLERVRAVFGAAPGVLVRLRHWMWSRYLLFFGGPAGVYRHGRPRFSIRRGTTDLGKLSREAGCATGS